MFLWRTFSQRTRPLIRFHSTKIDISPEVETALKEKKPVVALESTIITHGMPSPQNLITALAVEEIIREQGVVPATIGVIDGRVKVGLKGEELTKLADPSTRTVKISRRDFPFVLSNGLSGGTTVSGTIMIARAVGINIFVTGGIGGVHKNGENTLDISADLNELGRNPIMTVCSGVKSILDIQRTLEYLETEGVCVASYGPSINFPAFYSIYSGYQAPYHVVSPKEAAKLLQGMLELNMTSGILLAVPVPDEFAIDYEEMDAYISLALQKAEKEGKSGKEITPFVLSELANVTKGKTLESNIALIKNNALVGAKVAREYFRLLPFDGPRVVPSTKSAVVIGGSNVDSVVRLQSEVKLDGRTLPGKIEQVAGGVGRNIADALGKLLKERTLLVSAIGNDQYGNFILDSVQHLNTEGLERKPNHRTACYTTIIDKEGETRIGVGDMEISDHIHPGQVSRHKRYLETSSILVLDGNLPLETINCALELANQLNIPVWYEPTDLSKADKPFQCTLWKNLSFVSPNLNELKEMAKCIGVTLSEEFCLDDKDKLIEQVKYLATPLAKEIPIVMVTMSRHGVLMVSQAEENEPVLSAFFRKANKIHSRYYEPITIPILQNTSGAGDCTASGYISGVLKGLKEAECISLGLQAGQDSLYSHKPVPDEFAPHTTYRPNCYEI